jgi:hypothetical protein
VSPNLLRAFARRFEAGAHAVQASYGVRNARASWRTRLLVIALALFHVLRSLGRERLGLSVGLRGNGMGLSREVLRRVPHDAFSIVEDVEYGLQIGEAGYRVHHVAEAEVRGDMAEREGASRAQRRRWERGRRALARAYGPRLFREALARRDRPCCSTSPWTWWSRPSRPSCSSRSWAGPPPSGSSRSAARPVGSGAVARRVPPSSDLRGARVEALRHGRAGPLRSARARARLRVLEAPPAAATAGGAPRRVGANRAGDAPWRMTPATASCSASPARAPSSAVRAAPAPSRQAKRVATAKQKGPDSQGSGAKLPESAMDWERLWLATLRFPWTTLGFVPIGEALATPAIAAALAAVGWHNNEGAVVARDASQVSLATLKSELSSLIDSPGERRSHAGGAAAAAREPRGTRAGARPDALVLCISFGESPIAEAEQVLVDVGRARVLGTVIVRL